MVRIRAAVGSTILSRAPRRYLVTDDYVHRGLRAGSRGVPGHYHPALPRSGHDPQPHANSSLGEAGHFDDGHFRYARSDDGQWVTAFRSPGRHALL